MSEGFNKVLDDNKKDMGKIEEYKNKALGATPRNLLFGFGSLAVFLMFIAFSAQIITGIFALVLTVVVAVGGLFGFKTIKALDPAFRQKMKNLRLKLMMEEARKNATIQLDNHVLANTSRLVAARSARDQVGGTLQKLKTNLQSDEAGSRTYVRKEEMYLKVKGAYELISDNLVRAAESNKEFEVKVSEYKDMDQFASLASEAMGVLNSTGGMNLEDMLSLESFNSIEDNFNTAMVSLENSARDYAVDNS